MSDDRERALRGSLRQPDQRSCGATCLVVARMLLDPTYAALARDRFDQEVLAMHRRVTRPVDAAGRLQLPWPRVVGTPPWAVAHQLGATAGPGLPAVHYRWRPALRGGADLVDRVARATDSGRPVALYVGDRWLPRHVVLVISCDARELRVHDPARGTVVRVPRESLSARRLSFGRWTRPWFVVLPG